jgi:hypothetical protein
MITMSNLDKIVKLACKPKNAPPKPKVSCSLRADPYVTDHLPVHRVSAAVSSQGWY